MTSTRPAGGRRAQRVAATACVAAGLLLAGCGGQEPAGDPQAAPGSPSSRPPASPSAGKKASPPALDQSRPVRVNIPAIDVNSPVEPMGLKANDEMEVPSLDRPKLTGWYKNGPTPGEMGPSIITGHVDSDDKPAVFYDLKELKQGDKVRVKRKDGSVATFRIDSIKRFPKKDFPTQRVYGELDYPGIRLITCGGALNQSTGHYKDNVIAFGRLVSTKTAST